MLPMTATPFNLLAVLLATLMLHCHRPPTPAQPGTTDIPIGDTSRNSLDWPGTYLGQVPNTAGDAVTTSLQIREDGTYRLETNSETGQEEPTIDTGQFEWQPDDGIIKLLGIDSTERPVYYQVGENRLRQLDFVNQSIEGKVNDRYLLTKNSSGLRGSSWALATLNGQPVDLGKSQPTLEFAGTLDRLSGMAGCNRYSTTYSLVDGTNLDIPSPVATKMACPELSVEQAYLEALEGTITFERTGDVLRLQDAAGAEVATFDLR
ncbi:MAG: META domain-containing protein [Lewinella sp.]